jgi:hypothetical protein
LYQLLKKLLRARASRQPVGRACYAAPADGRDRDLITVVLPDGQLATGERAEPHAGGQGPVPATVYGNITFGRRRRRWYSRVPRWVRWSAGTAIVILFFRRAVTWALITGASGALHLIGVNLGLPHVKFGWPWSSLTAPAAASNVLVGPLVLAKIEGIGKPALGSTTFDFMFTHKVSKSMGFLPCWYSATFSAVGKASATVDLNPGTAWWAPATGHYALTVLSKPTGSTPGQVSITMTLPAPQLPQTVHDVSVDDTLSKPVSTDHSWTYPGLACGAIIKPQFTQSVLYAQAQQEAFTQATTVKSVTQPLIAAAEKQAGKIIGGNFITPTLGALGYKVSSFTIHWAASAQ